MQYVVIKSKSYQIVIAIWVGIDCHEGPPVPIPNTEVKLMYADDTWWVTAWENK